jgi:hypothetical protein
MPVAWDWVVAKVVKVEQFEMANTWIRALTQRLVTAVMDDSPN